MKILLLAHRLPWPLHDGYNLHNHHYVRQLAGRHAFHLVAVDEGALPAGEHARFASVTVVAPRPAARRGTLARLFQALSVEQVFDRDPAVGAAIAGVVVRHGPFDLVWTAGAKMLVHSRSLGAAPVLADIADEAAGEALHDLRAARGFVPRLRALKNLVNTWRFQRRYLAHAPICTVVSEADRAVLARNLPGLDVRVVPNGVDTGYFAPLGGPPEDPSLVFEGSMGFRPNAEGLLAFCADTLPLIRQRVPGVRLVAVGKDPTPEVAALAGPGVTITGFVDDVRPWVDRASLFICPLRRGAGIKNKILQAWAMEKAVVATPVSCGGLAVEPGVNIEIAATPEDFARVVCELLADPARRAALGRAGRATVAARYAWPARAAAMEAILVELAARPPAQR